MRTNLFKKVTALGMATAMLFSTNAFALSDVNLSTGFSSTGTSTITSPVYKVKVPSTVVFAIDPLEMGGPATAAINTRTPLKVAGKGFGVYNYSNIDITMTVEASTVLAANVYPVKLKDINTPLSTVASLASIGNAAIRSDADTKANKEKEVSMYMLVGKDVKILSNGALSAAYTKTGALEMNVTGKDNARATFLLPRAKVTSDGKLTTTNGEFDPKGYQYKKLATSTMSGLAAFSFQGDINVYAPWAANDIKIAMKYTFDPISRTNAIALSTDTGIGLEMTTATALIKGFAYKASVLPADTAAPVMGAMSFSRATATGAALNITSLGTGYKAITTTGAIAYSVKITGGTLPVTLTPGTEFSIAGNGAGAGATNLKLLILSTTANTAAVNKIKALPNGTYKLELTAKNGKVIKSNLTIAD